MQEELWRCMPSESSAPLSAMRSIAEGLEDSTCIEMFLEFLGWIWESLFYFKENSCRVTLRGWFRQAAWPCKEAQESTIQNANILVTFLDLASIAVCWQNGDRHFRKMFLRSLSKKSSTQLRCFYYGSKVSHIKIKYWTWIFVFIWVLDFPCVIHPRFAQVQRYPCW